MKPSAADAICQFIPPFMRFLRDGLAEVAMSPGRFQILQSLRQGGALTMVDLAERLSVTKRNVTSLVDGLEKDGLAVRLPHPTDRRATLVELTKDGEAAFEKAARVQRDHLAELMSNLDDDQQENMGEALARLTEALSARGRS